MQLAQKTALITGAARGIGRAIAAAFIREGAQVAVADIDAHSIASTANELGERAWSLPMDVTDQVSIDEGVNRTIDHFGQIDILINNAALFTAAPLVEINRADYSRVFDVNVSGTLFMTQAVARHMIARCQGGKIINMASQAGRRGEPLVAVYCATKAAVISLTQSTGLDLIKHGINVNAISPGVVDGEHWDDVDALFAKYENKELGQKKREVGAGVPFGRMGTPEDLTGMAVFLASHAANYIVAQTYNVDGGQWMS
ncbi:L-iditol 2-dehydrogenase [Ruegeria atlantica]|uniref:Sorbitol dehydrogenase n=1 Tax=Ruegeria atlantica TaxID=81569 RepID=A0A0P1E5M7_9RHOB|nr:L-iditol 2-dehydrogenase [Ruegeria atlantica]CUH43944.1 Sorbitol dehydrogenase [Ruegeria atlantica]